MGHTNKAKAAKVGEGYNWGAFGSANANGVNLSQDVMSNIGAAQAGTQQYLNELLNPSYNNESFRARQDILDASNNQYANQLGASAIERGARGSATQNILNSILANRNNDMRNAMTQEDQRVANILGQTQGVETNYFNQSNAMANNILQRIMGNQNSQNQTNQFNAQQANNRTNALFGMAGTLGSSLAKGYFGMPAAAAAPAAAADE